MQNTIEIQKLLGLKPDGDWGPISRAAFDAAVARGVHPVIASSFADPGDVAAFRRCKAQGKSDQACFAIGDNGIGLWGDDTTAPFPMCALPPEDWHPFFHTARGKKVRVKSLAHPAGVVCELRDTMPARAHITNGRGIDLNPEACEALGVKPGDVELAVTWEWA